jgi:hypothetical protein
VRFSKLTHKRGRRSAKSEKIRSQWQAARTFVQDQALLDSLKEESVCSLRQMLLLTIMLQRLEGLFRRVLKVNPVSSMVYYSQYFFR